VTARLVTRILVYHKRIVLLLFIGLCKILLFLSVPVTSRTLERPQEPSFLPLQSTFFFYTAYLLKGDESIAHVTLYKMLALLDLVVDFRFSHFAFRGRPPSLLDTVCLRGLVCLTSPAGVFVPYTSINWQPKSTWFFNTAKMLSIFHLFDFFFC
jgi:hypothetical protein